MSKVKTKARRPESLIGQERDQWIAKMNSAAEWTPEERLQVERVRLLIAMDVAFADFEHQISCLHERLIAVVRDVKIVRGGKVRR